MLSLRFHLYKSYNATFRATRTRKVYSDSHVHAAASEVGWDGTVEELQALVASLKMAVDFTQAVSSTMGTLTQLLASSTASDVQVGNDGTITCTDIYVSSKF